jgi:hypothetical protein
MRLAGSKAYQSCHGVGPRGAERLQGARRRGPIYPDKLQDSIVKLNRVGVGYLFCRAQGQRSYAPYYRIKATTD